MDLTKKVNLYFGKDEEGQLIHTRLIPNDFVFVYAPGKDVPRQMILQSIAAINRELGVNSSKSPYVRPFCFDKSKKEFLDENNKKGILGMALQPELLESVVELLLKQGYIIDKKYA
ncbi:MAG: hypothetical protein ACP5N1_06870 [Candidatus Woesearchaeota archaeon]